MAQAAGVSSMLVDAYLDVVGEFRELTGLTWMNNRCCARTYGQADVPECCHQVAEGARLYFTPLEVEILGACGLHRGNFAPRGDAMGTFDLDRAMWPKGEILASLHNGTLADTIESASHPTRPVIGMDGAVIGVVAVPGCNTGVALTVYRAHRERLRGLWRRALNLTGGLKEYYVTYDLRPEWVVI